MRRGFFRITDEGMRALENYESEKMNNLFKYLLIGFALLWLGNISLRYFNRTAELAEQEYQARLWREVAQE